MIIEFFGAPGAGKSPLMRALLRARPSTREVQAHSRGGVMRSAALFALRHPISFFIWIYTLLTNKGGLLRYKLGLTLRSMAAHAQAESYPYTDLVVIDEGLLQRILTLFDEPLSPSRVNFLLAHTPMPDLAVVVQGGDFRRFTRKAGYEKSPRVRQGKEQFEQWQKAVAVNAERIAQALPLHTKVFVHERGELIQDLGDFPQKIERLLKDVL
jgi:hypothetical protein